MIAWVKSANYPNDSIHIILDLFTFSCRNLCGAELDPHVVVRQTWNVGDSVPAKWRCKGCFEAQDSAVVMEFLST